MSGSTEQEHEHELKAVEGGGMSYITEGEDGTRDATAKASAVSGGGGQLVLASPTAPSEATPPMRLNEVVTAIREQLGYSDATPPIEMLRRASEDWDIRLAGATSIKEQVQRVAQAVGIDTGWAPVRSAPAAELELADVDEGGEDSDEDGQGATQPDEGDDGLDWSGVCFESARIRASQGTRQAEEAASAMAEMAARASQASERLSQPTGPVRYRLRQSSGSRIGDGVIELPGPTTGHAEVSLGRVSWGYGAGTLALIQAEDRRTMSPLDCRAQRGWSQPLGRLAEFGWGCLQPGKRDRTMLSRRHATLAYDAARGAFTLTDNGSGGGTFVNGTVRPPP